MIVVVGAGAAGLTAVETVRRGGYDGPVTVVGDEPHAPYDRPPLSKQVLRGAWEPARVALRKPEAVDELDARWLSGTRAVGFDAAARTIALADGSELAYEGAVIATGVTPRRLRDGHELDGVHVLRSLDDSVAIRKRLVDATSVVVVGAGFLGAEVAAVARELGLAVTMVDPLPGPMIRQFGAELSGYLADLHTGRGVDVRCGVGVAGFTERDGAVAGVRLDGGETLPADVVLVAIGCVPAVDWLAGSGLTIGNGVECDEYLLAAPGVVAAGDVASWPHPDHGRLRIEHRMNATEQGAAAARTLLGERTPFAPIPYFWTDQYDVKVQVHGVPTPDAEFRVVTGDPADGRFGGLYGSGGRVTASLTWNLPREALKLRKLVVDRADW